MAQSCVSFQFYSSGHFYIAKVNNLDAWGPAEWRQCASWGGWKPGESLTLSKMVYGAQVGSCHGRLSIPSWTKKFSRLIIDQWSGRHKWLESMRLDVYEIWKSPVTSRMYSVLGWLSDPRFARLMLCFRRVRDDVFLHVRPPKFSTTLQVLFLLNLPCFVVVTVPLCGTQVFRSFTILVDCSLLLACHFQRGSLKSALVSPVMACWGLIMSCCVQCRDCIFSVISGHGTGKLITTWLFLSQHMPPTSDPQFHSMFSKARLLSAAKSSGMASHSRDETSHL